MTVKALLKDTICYNVRIKDIHTKETLMPSEDMIVKNDFGDFNNRIVKYFCPDIDYDLDLNFNLNHKLYLTVVCDSVPFDGPYTT